MKFSLLKQQWESDMQGVRSFFEQAASHEAGIKSVNGCPDDPEILEICIEGNFSPRQKSEMDKRGWEWGA